MLIKLEFPVSSFLRLRDIADVQKSEPTVWRIYNYYDTPWKSLANSDQRFFNGKKGWGLETLLGAAEQPVISRELFDEAAMVRQLSLSGSATLLSDVLGERHLSRCCTVIERREAFTLTSFGEGYLSDITLSCPAPKGGRRYAQYRVVGRQEVLANLSEAPEAARRLRLWGYGHELADEVSADKYGMALRLLAPETCPELSGTKSPSIDGLEMGEF